jgi:hypothetical protein
VRHLCIFNHQNNSSSVGAAYSDAVAPDGAKKHLGILCYNDVTPTAFRATVRHSEKARVKSARGLAHSQTLRAVHALDRRASVLECDGPPPLGWRGEIHPAAAIPAHAPAFLASAKPSPAFDMVILTKAEAISPEAEATFPSRKVIFTEAEAVFPKAEAASVSAKMTPASGKVLFLSGKTGLAVVFG